MAICREILYRSNKYNKEVGALNITDEEMNRLTRTNRMVLKSYLKASDLQRAQMHTILKEQTENLAFLLSLMDKYDNRN